ncbi:MBOAT family protein [Dysgonomonas sp. 25]|uniref:MBOAT family O-acyltransferase n=1 Tax=Dysgonomonas sp. 25 TaxID=2302933 RepID=UPI0013D4F18C|nr:MBOAT family protein [Dysgonomonas sp. 25]NDV69756.1 MBOAT family protein [Dysgonomonas sp. 25]NDV70188.1 MBOAT family protein [Dysgonomonas sp. 25]
MLFNSINFAIFFPIVFFIYWLVLKNNKKAQNVFLLVASYFFYGCWDWRFLFLLAISTILCYYGGLRVSTATTKSGRKTWMFIAVIVNICFLGFFKYFNFFIHEFQEFLQLFGLSSSIHTLSIILPVGISFYTFHGLSYVLDIYNDRIKPTRNWVDYSLFVSFFPLLVAGPIERATHLLPQIEQERTFRYAKMVDGLKQILWGLFKKVVVADNCAEYANMAFNGGEHSGSTLVLGAIFFTIQIYGDFSGYSDIALGTARMLGFELLQNFKFPYFSRDIAEFWRRWHISLSSWFRDYLYFPLGGSRGTMLKTIRNTFIIFLVSGFWHGANWTFIAWGGLNALFIMPSIIMKQNRKNLDVVAQGKLLPSFKDILHVGITFALAAFAWIFFRADNMTHAFEYIASIPKELLTSPHYDTKTLITIGMFLLMFIVEWLGRENKYGLEFFGAKRSRFFRWAFYYMIIVFIILFAGGEQQFIYFQF